MNDEMKTKVTIFYDKTGEIYAFSENNHLITLFEGTRMLHGYIKKKVTMTGMQYRSFLAFYQNRMMFLNVLTDGDKSFDFVTTYQENSDLDKRCEEIYDTLLRLESKLLPLPLDDKARKALGNLVSLRKSKEGKYGKYNTFEIFINLFKDSIL